MDRIQTGTQLIGMQPGWGKPDPAKPDSPLLLDGGLFLIPVGFLMVWAFAIALYSGLPKILPQRLLNLRPRQQVPCRDCRFFHCNPYLQCAIRPTDVLSAKAENCNEYSPRE